MNIIEYLIQQNKTKIENSIYQNTIYKGKTLCEHLGVTAVSKKKGRDFTEFLSDVVDILPHFNYHTFMRDISKYKRYKNQYIMFGYKLIQIKDIFDLIEKYKENTYFPVSVSSPSFSSRSYKILMVNKLTKEQVIKQYSIEDYKKEFGDILHTNYVEILEKENIKNYYGLLF